jgi:hypothetical protein
MSDSEKRERRKYGGMKKTDYDSVKDTMKQLRTLLNKKLGAAPVSIRPRYR